ncbi:hypothetical protein J6590_047206 [Homalodisca vitripennis]|nr:hypothetical protein J6590_047206 [Homalodisca vitripennis]
MPDSMMFLSTTLTHPFILWIHQFSSTLVGWKNYLKPSSPGSSGRLLVLHTHGRSLTVTEKLILASPPLQNFANPYLTCREKLMAFTQQNARRAAAVQKNQGNNCSYNNLAVPTEHEWKPCNKDNP